MLAGNRRLIQLHFANGNYAGALQAYEACRVILAREMTLFRGSREIQLKFLGRGHTAGDVVVYLPREKVVITGDFLTAGMSNMSDSYPNEWADSLEALKKLDFTTVLPGHGEAYTDKTKIDNYQAYLRDAWAQASKLKQQGVSAEEAVKRIDALFGAGAAASRG